jgi:hypothetical protein
LAARWSSVARRYPSIAGTNDGLDGDAGAKDDISHRHVPVQQPGEMARARCAVGALARPMPQCIAFRTRAVCGSALNRDRGRPKLLSNQAGFLAAPAPHHLADLALERAMNRNCIECNWQELKGEIKAHWVLQVPLLFAALALPARAQQARPATK